MSGVWTGRRVLFCMLGFFGVIFVVNGIFVYMATTTWTGLSTENAYKKGIRYNDTLDAARAQDQLGWQSKVAVGKGSDNLIAQFKAKDGAPVTGLKIIGTAVRPTHEGYDKKLIFVETQSGTYVANGRLPLKGNWRIELVATSSDGKSFRVNHTLLVKSRDKS
ncbi:MAG: FixH family protein [Rhodospirillales bacterium]|nr:FixH family protein [Rhodospirillales bacterium]